MKSESYECDLQKMFGAGIMKGGTKMGSYHLRWPSGLLLEEVVLV